MSLPSKTLDKKINPFLIRSWLTFPAIKEKFIQKIFTLHEENKPDAIIFDLEDPIAKTFDAKTQARDTIAEYLSKRKEYSQEIFSNFIVGIRINNDASPANPLDIDVVKETRPHVLFIPKTEDKQEVIKYQKLFPQIHICAIIETLKGYLNREKIMKALRPTDMVGIGYEDLSAELAIEKPEDFNQPSPLIHILNGVIISAKINNVILIEGPSRKYGSKENLINLKRECLLSLHMGFESKVAIHPTQIAIINSVFDKKRLVQQAEGFLQQFNSLVDGTFVIASDKQEMRDTPSFNLYTKIIKKYKGLS